VVEVVTNNTLDNKIMELLDSPKKDLKRLIVKCSLHWVELKRLNKVDSYFENIRKIVAAGASAYPFLVICEEYLPMLDEICETCERELGELPPCTPCTTAETPEEFLQSGGVGTNPACTPEFVNKINKKLHSNLFQEAVRFLSFDVRKLFCYAGAWSFVVEMQTGMMSKCHNVQTEINFFEHIDAPIKCDPVGCECGIASCSLQYCFYGPGLIPEIPNVPTYTGLVASNSRLFNEEVKQLMDSKISDIEKVLSKEEQLQFYAQQIHKKNKVIEVLEQKERNREKCMAEEKQQKQRKDVECLLAMVDEQKTTYDNLKEIHYDSMIYIKSICDSMQGGQEMYRHVWEKIVQGLFTTYTYKKPNYIYHKEEDIELDQISKLPIVMFVSEANNVERMIQCMQSNDYVECAKIICEQMQIVCR
jgi:hypothetical protein